VPVLPERGPRGLAGLFAEPACFITRSAGVFAQPFGVIARAFGVIEGSLDIFS
jgi:hypothetical protein